MRKAFSLVAVVVLVVLVVLIIQRSPESTAPLPNDRTDASPVQATSTSLPSTDISVTTSAGGGAAEVTTDTTEVQSIDTAPEPVPDSGLPAQFAITEIVFGEGGYVVITNVGGSTASVGGLALCQRPFYFTLPDIELAPLESVWVAAGDGASLTASSAVAVLTANGSLDDFSRDDGEMGLYLSSDFGSAEAIISYVEWGSAGHGRSDVAIEAGLWEADAFIEIPDDAFGVQASAQAPSGPQDWVAGLGG
ncbi:MAG TPA: hypothetical protein ENH15_00645 [Actinobacteria bacterium]|nr:hypothetical protein [Actinomycetota bacterium]